MKTAFALFLVLASVACDGSTESTTTTSTLPPQTTSTTSLQIVDGGLIPVDPPTLIPLEGEEPVLTGLSHSGVISPNGRWAAITTELATGQPGVRLSIVDLESMTNVTSADVDARGTVVNDEGRAFFFVDGGLMTLGIDGALAAVDAPDSPAFLQETLVDLGEGRVGYLTSSDGERSNVRVVVVDGVQTLDVEVQVAAGPLSVVTTTPARDPVVPAVAWTSNLAYVVSAEENRVEVVDLVEGRTIDEHRFEGADETFDHAVKRSVAISDAGFLLVATSSLEVVETEDGWDATESPGMLVVIDTADWSTTSRDTNVDTLFGSPDRSVVAAMGTLATWDENADATVTQGPVYLIDTTTGEPLVGFQGNSGTILDVQFSSDGAEMYVISVSELGTNVDVVDVASQTLAGNVGFTRISLVGEAGLLAFHTSP